MSGEKEQKPSQGRTKRDKIFDNTFEETEYEFDTSMSFALAPRAVDNRSEEDENGNHQYDARDDISVDNDDNEAIPENNADINFDHDSDQETHMSEPNNINDIDENDENDGNESEFDHEDVEAQDNDEVRW